jgi:transcription-repair coupling factor (superfamily II helicase)
VRIEFFGNTIETLRFFDPETQRSFDRIERLQVVPRGGAALTVADAEEAGEGASFLAYLPADTRLVVCDPVGIAEHLSDFAGSPVGEAWAGLADSHAGSIVHLVPPGVLTEEPVPDGFMVGKLACHGLDQLFAPLLPELGPDASRQHWRHLRDTMLQWSDSGYEIVACCGNAGEAARFRELLATDGAALALKPRLLDQALERGILLPDARLAILGEHELFGKRVTTHRRVQRYRADYAAGDEMALEEECYAVHASHGICRFKGISEIEANGVLQEALELEFADDTRLYVPLTQACLVTRYVGGTRRLPKLSRIGGSAWKQSKDAARLSAHDLAAELLRIEAMRRHARGFAFEAESDWEHSFASAFPYLETPDQQQAIQSVLADMSRSEPMDRLLCGDVGYGKTEVAMRAAFRAIMNRKQVAVLVPTTILAQQHYLTFCDRMAEYPIAIEMLSRFRTGREQAAIVEKLALGQIDIVIGTHRLLQDDISFHNLGLVIIDEEQRFGVKHKERFKRLRASVDILTMTATPIPRTLYLGLSGLRHLSTIMTPPAERLPIRTTVAQYDEPLIREALLREVERQGQAFFLHNRVQTIGRIRQHLARLVPEARFGLAHGQMPPHELESVMLQYLRKEIDVLVCTTIIESGLDIPNANTIIIDRADRFGLAELYQLRGRVGRYHHQAYAYLLLPPLGSLPRNARERLAAIRQYTHLGAGFKLALRDLEIRGAGNILGAEQSGQIAAVGFELYCELLREAVNQLEKRPEPVRMDVSFSMPGICFGYQARANVLPACLPADYVPDQDLRLKCCRRISQLRRASDADEFLAELEDRFGPVPPAAARLLQVARIKALALERGIRSIAVRGQRLFLETAEGLIAPGGRLPVFQAEVPAEQLLELAKIIEHMSAGS